MNYASKGILPMAIKKSTSDFVLSSGTRDSVVPRGRLNVCSWSLKLGHKQDLLVF